MNRELTQASYDLSPLYARVTWSDISQYLQSTGHKKYQIYTKEIITIMMVAFGILTIVSLVLGFTINSAILVGVGFWLSLMLAACPVILSHQKSKFTRQVRLSHFAKANGLVYTSVAKDDLGHKAMIFPTGWPGLTTGVISTTPSVKLQFEIGHHFYLTGSGKSQREYHWDYICIQLDRNLPHIVLDSKKNNLSLFGVNFDNLPNVLDKEQQIRLEGDFDKHFTLYGPSGYDTDVRYIFTPDLMTLLIDEATDYDVEVVDDRIYFFQKTDSSDFARPYNPMFFDRAFRIIATVGAKVDRRTDYYADERVGSRVANEVAPDGRRLKQASLKTIMIIVAAVVVSAYVLVNILANL